ALKTRSLRTSEDAKKIFFFSSRRRHTRFSRDWSSDVCSSDLPHQRIKERLTDLLFDPHSLCRIEGSGMHFPALIERGCQRTKVHIVQQFFSPLFQQWLKLIAIGTTVPEKLGYFDLRGVASRNRFCQRPVMTPFLVAKLPPFLSKRRQWPHHNQRQDPCNQTTHENLSSLFFINT